MAEECTNTSSAPSWVMNPYPFASLNHFTCPVAIPRTSLWGSSGPFSAPAAGAGSPSGIGRQTKTPRELAPRGVCPDVSLSLPNSVCTRPGAKDAMGARVKSIEFYGPGDGPGAVLRAQPAGNRDRKPAGRAPRDHDVELLHGRELGDHGLGPRRLAAVAEVRALAVPLVGEQLPVRPGAGLLGGGGGG